MRHLSPSPSANKQNNVLLRAVLFLIAVHVGWTVGCAWIEVHSKSGSGGLLGAEAGKKRSAREWSLQYEERQDDEEDDNARRVAANNIANGEQQEEPRIRNDSAWTFDPSNARAVQSALLKTTGRNSLPLRAYAEPPLPPEPPKIFAAFEINATKQQQSPRLSVRTHSPKDLTMYEYPKIRTCSDIPKFLPTGHPSSDDEIFGTDSFNMQPLHPIRHEYARNHCPVDADPFLPWVHDVFPSNDGYIEFVAHNKRRCNTDPKVFFDDIVNLEPQVSIRQPVPLKRLEGGDEEANRLQPQMWMPKKDVDLNKGRLVSSVHRYRLASHEEADEDGMETRFICRFHTLRVRQSNEESVAPQLENVIIGETLSVTPYNYELLHFRKPGLKAMLTRPANSSAKGGPGSPPDNSAVWNGMNHFRCPIPEELVDVVKSGVSVVDDIPSIYVDIVPVRTYPRDTKWGYIKGVGAFDPDVEWGRNHVLPVVEASGRWSNFPICRPPAKDTTKKNMIDTEPSKRKEKDYLIGCTWASATFATRGNGNLDTSTSERMFEWLTYNFEVAGFDHIYIFDNTAARTNATSLAPITDLFPGRVTRVEWGHRICNNNPPTHSNSGERSSQYAAEASCRIRYGPSAEWLASFDSDEYFVPIGKWKSISEWLREGISIEKETHILSFFQTRAKPIAELMAPYQDDSDCRGSSNCLAKNSSMTYLETYNCEPTTLPKPDWANRAKKQIYRPWYVLNHFVHYTMATTRINEYPEEVVPRYKANPPYERRADELTEAFMLHTKTTPPRDTVRWHRNCEKSPGQCPVGVPHPLGGNGSGVVHGLGTQFKPNCYQNDRVLHEIGPRLRDALLKSKK